MMPKNIEVWLKDLANRDSSVETLKSLVRIREKIQAEEKRQVLSERSKHTTWETIGEIYGVSRQAVYDRFGKIRK